ncbi:hypothetical protein MMC25_003539 [Agyrium rufum]|nr:hypothetical protein [Agyrium rufum]
MTDLYSYRNFLQRILLNLYKDFILYFLSGEQITYSQNNFQYSVQERVMSESRACATCKRSETELPTPLKRCAKCHGTSYCSRECQKADWKTHKKQCGNRASGGNGQPSASSSDGTVPGAPNLDFMSSLSGMNFSGIDTSTGQASATTTTNPFSGDALQLETLPEKEAYKLIIDSYRMRAEDEYAFAQNQRGLYAQENPLTDFRRYLRKAERRGGVLPTWWSDEKSTACQRQGMDKTQWSDLSCAVEKSDIQEHYRDSMMPLKLRVLAEKIEGSNVMSMG